MASNQDYPPCNFRLDGNGTRARCNSPASIYCGCFVTITKCQRCQTDPPKTDERRLLPKRRRPRETPASNSPASTNDAPDPPGLVRRILSYAEAVARWTAAGRPERPDKEVERIFNKNCKTCKWFDPEKQICRGCGCRVAETGVAVLNKIKMATEHCPRELW